MDIFPILTAIADWTGWAFVAILAILGGGIALWITNQRFESMNQRIEALKESNEWLKLRLADAENFAPSALVERLTSRYKAVNDELELLNADYKANEQRIKTIEFEKQQITTEFENIASSLYKAVLETCSYNCLYCSQPNRIGKVEIPLVRDGERFIIDIESKCQSCGHKTMSIQKTGTSFR